MKPLSLLSLSTIVLSTFASGAQADDLFPDKQLEAVVRKYVFEKRDNNEPLNEKDVENISTIEGKRAGIKSLQGLEKCFSLALLDLEGNEVEDISQLKELTNLQSLNLAHNKIADIGPLSELTGLQYLHLAHNQVTDLKPLAKMTNMRSLYLSNNQIKDLSPLEPLNKIWSLYLDGNQLTDISVLSQLKDLSSLDLRGNGISDIGPLGGLTELRYLFLQQNKISDLSVLVEMARKDREEKHDRFALFWRIYLADNPLSEEARTKQLEALKATGSRVILE
jgi:Leucine-rich repeat (LRR) protein